MRYYIGGFVLTLLGFMSCSQPTKNTPEAAVEGFITAIEQKEFDKAKQYGDSTVVVQMTKYRQCSANKEMTLFLLPKS